MILTEFNEKKTDFLAYLEVERNVSVHTLRAYKLDLEQFSQFWQRIQTTESIPLTFRQTLERFLIMLYHKKIDKSTIARKISCFQSFEKFLFNQGIILNLKLTRPTIDKKLPIYLSVDEIFYLLDAIKPEELPSAYPYRDRAIFELLYATGVRCSELIAIKLQDIDMQAKTIRIFGKGKKERIVLFGQKAYERVQDYLEKERQPVKNTQEVLFLNCRHEALTSRSIQRIFEMFRKFLKIQRPITPHKIRHSFATHLLNQGADLRIVQELLGHKNIVSTERYTHITSSQLAEMCDTLHPLITILKEKK